MHGVVAVPLADLGKDLEEAGTLRQTSTLSHPTGPACRPLGQTAS